MSTDNHERTHAAGATIAWGVILLVIAGTAFAVVTFDISTITPSLIGWAVVGLGALLVVAAIVGVVARAVRPAEPVAPVTPGATPETEGQPIG